MERRTFLAATLAALATPYLPAAGAGAKVPDPVIWNTATLTAQLEKMFACQMGPAAPLFEMVMGAPMAIRKIQKPHPIYPNLTIEDSTEPTDPSQRYVYETYACAVEGGDAQEAEARLAKHFYDAFSTLPTGTLVWRIKPQFETCDHIRWGVTYATDVQVEDRLYDLANLPEDAQYDTDNASYRQVLSKTQLHKMRMRLVLPHLYDREEETVAIPGLFKPEGAQITRMI